MNTGPLNAHGRRLRTNYKEGELTKLMNLVPSMRQRSYTGRASSHNRRHKKNVPASSRAVEKNLRARIELDMGRWCECKAPASTAVESIGREMQQIDRRARLASSVYSRIHCETTRLTSFIH